MSIVKLRTGEEVNSAVVKTVGLALNLLAAENIIVFYELVQICKDPDRSLFGPTSEPLLELGLIKQSGQKFHVRDEVRAVVLASVEGEDLEMKLVNPIGIVQEVGSSAELTTRADLMDFELYVAARTVSDIVHAITAKNGFKFYGDRMDASQSANPFYNQTASGLFLEMYYGTPSRLWTPWGKYRFLTQAGGGDWEAVWEEASSLFRATVHQPGEFIPSTGHIGPVFALHYLDGPLPKPNVLARTSYAGYEEVKAAWSALTERYDRRSK